MSLIVYWESGSISEGEENQNPKAHLTNQFNSGLFVDLHERLLHKPIILDQFDLLTYKKLGTFEEQPINTYAMFIFLHDTELAVRIQELGKTNSTLTTISKGFIDNSLMIESATTEGMQTYKQLYRRNS